MHVKVMSLIKECLSRGENTHSGLDVELVGNKVKVFRWECKR